MRVCTQGKICILAKILPLGAHNDKLQGYSSPVLEQLFTSKISKILSLIGLSPAKGELR